MNTQKINSTLLTTFEIFLYCHMLCAHAIPMVLTLLWNGGLIPYSQAGLLYLLVLTALQSHIANKQMEAYLLEASLDCAGGDQPA